MCNAIFSEDIIKALSWTLLHSIWQGLILAIVAGVIVLATKKASPLLRYNLVSIALVLFVTVVVATFVNQILYSFSFETKIATRFSENASQIVYIDWNIVEYNNSIVGQLKQFINQYSFWIACCWFCVIAFKFLKMTVGIYGMYRLKTSNVTVPNIYWQNKLNDLCNQLHIKQKAQLLQSSLITVPAVVGYLKPVILFPVAIFTALPVHEIEAILIHELGHIRRRDFIVNLLQHTVEIVFFFNPAVLWVSSLIKTERENCCDEITVTNTGNKKGYIQALLSFESLQLKTPALATAFAGEKNSLLHRVERIIYNKNKTLNHMEKKFLSISLLMLSIFLVAAISNKAQVKSSIPVTPAKPVAPKKPNMPIEEPETSNLPKGTKTITAFDNNEVVSQTLQLPSDAGFTGRSFTKIDGKEHVVSYANGVPYELTIDGEKIPKEKFGDYKSTIDKLRKQIEMDIKQAKKNEEQARKNEQQSRLVEEQARRNEEQSRLNEEQARKNEEQSRLNEIQARKNEEQYRRNEEQSRSDAMNSENDFQIRMKNITSDLIDENIIDKASDLRSIFLDNSKLIINGKLQSSSIHSKFKVKYVKSKGWTLNLTRRGDEETTTLTNDDVEPNNAPKAIAPIKPIKPVKPIKPITSKM